MRRNQEDVIATTGSGSAATATEVTREREAERPSLEAPASRLVASPDVGETSAYRWVDRHLRLVSVVLPVCFIVVLELIRFAVDGSRPAGHSFFEGYRIALVGVTTAAIVVFALVMFGIIDRARQQVVTHNRELGAIDTAAGAIHAEMRVERIVEVALAQILTATTASRASVLVYAPDRGSADHPVGMRTTMTRGSARPDVSDVSDATEPGGMPTPTLDLPLVAANVSVGRLQLWQPQAAGVAPATDSRLVRGVGHHLANAIQIAQLVGDLNRRKNEGHAFYDVLLQISNHKPPADILDALVQHARVQLRCDAVVVSLTDEAARAVEFAAAPGDVSLRGGTWIASGVDMPDGGYGPGTRFSPSPDEWVAHTASTIQGPIGTLGELWVGRRSGEPFTDRDCGFLGNLSGFAAIAITSAQMRENGRQRAVLEERERIAREMHDSLAQVLGSTHLRLRGLEIDDRITTHPAIAAEIEDLAATCQEAYRDVREAILGLRDSSKTERGLEDNLRTYLTKYSQQSQIASRLEVELDGELALSPRCEVHVIRVVQEALTNVRKHADASSVVVRVAEDGPMTTFTVEDDGQGFDASGTTQDGDGFGLFTMRDRMTLLRGSLTVDSVPGRGTRVIASVPERSAPRPVS